MIGSLLAATIEKFRFVSPSYTMTSWKGLYMIRPLLEVAGMENIYSRGSAIEFHASLTRGIKSVLCGTVHCHYSKDIGDPAVECSLCSLCIDVDDGKVPPSIQVEEHVSVTGHSLIEVIHPEYCWGRVGPGYIAVKCYVIPICGDGGYADVVGDDAVPILEAIKNCM